MEAVYSVHHWKSAKNSRKAILETDTYVITPTNTNFQDLVPVALQRLGYSKENFYSAKGKLKNVNNSLNNVIKW